MNRWCGLLLAGVTSLAAAEIKTLDPDRSTGTATCPPGFVLITDVCINRSAIRKHSSQELAEAVASHKNPEMGSRIKAARAARQATGTPVFKTQIDEEEGDIYKLRNGGVVEVTSGYVGYVGYAKKALLYSEGGTWKLWIEGKKSYPVEVIREPEISATYVTTITEVLDLLE